MNINLSDLSDSALNNLIDEFILREGTDYGHSEPSLTHKRQQVLKRIQAHQASIVYDEETQSCNIIALE